jgi:hypothetical protein
MRSSIKKSRKKAEIKNDFELDEDEGIEVCNFSEGEPVLEGTLLRSFVFDDSSDEPIEVDLTSVNAAPISTKTSNIQANENSNNEATSSLNNNEISSKPESKKDITDYRFSKSNPLGRTPPVDGEAFDMVRCYTLRRSTVRILSKIKAIHLDDNVYLNTIVDEAIRHYYEYLKNSNV